MAGLFDSFDSSNNIEYVHLYFNALAEVIKSHNRYRHIDGKKTW